MVTDPTGGPSKARGTPPLSPPAPDSSFAHALVRNAPCALAGAARADKLGEERALHPLEKATPPNESQQVSKRVCVCVYVFASERIHLGSNS